MNIRTQPGDSEAASHAKQPTTRALAIVAVLSLAGCTTTPRLTPIDRQSEVAFVVVGSPPAQGTAAVQDKNVSHSASSGMKIGSVAGALAGLACGPFAVICVPAGALEGASTGAMAGAAVGLSNKLPKDTVAQLNERLKSLQQSLDPVAELRTDVLDTAHKHWQLTDKTSAGVVTLEVRGLTLTSAGRDKVALVMQVLVRMDAVMPADSSRRVVQKRFAVVSPKHTPAAWLDETGSVAEDSLRSACQRIASEIVSELAAS